jgi:hypothetical protein
MAGQVTEQNVAQLLDTATNNTNTMTTATTTTTTPASSSMREFMRIPASAALKPPATNNMFGIPG